MQPDERLFMLLVARDELHVVVLSVVLEGVVALDRRADAALLFVCHPEGACLYLVRESLQSVERCLGDGSCER